jgi:hypothetical protein
MKKLIATAALIISIFGTASSPLWAAKSNWSNLNTLKQGELIRIVLNDASSHEGAFRIVNDEGITLRRARGEQSFARKDISRVYIKSKDHEVRNIFIGAAIGAALATPLALANYRNEWWRSTAWVWPVFVGPGAVIGGEVPTGVWHEVYHARRH